MIYVIPSVFIRTIHGTLKDFRMFYEVLLRIQLTKYHMSLVVGILLAGRLSFLGPRSDLAQGTAYGLVSSDVLRILVACNGFLSESCRFMFVQD